MKNTKQTQAKGFTLIEVIVVLVLLGIIGTLLASATTTAITGYFFARDSAAKSQQAQLALARISREFLDMTNINASPSSDTVTYTTPYGVFQLTKAGTQITLAKTDSPAVSAQTLVQGVTTNYGSDSFLTFTQQDGSPWIYVANDISALYQIKVVIILDMYGGLQSKKYETTINPRNNTLSDMPRLY